MAKQNSKTNLLNHSEAKVLLLGEYIKRYINVIANDNHTKRIEIYDLFCGEGLYPDGGQGSPLVIAKSLKDLHFINQAKNTVFPIVDCYFNDKDKAKTENVKKAISDLSLHYDKFGKLDFTNIDYKEYLKNLVSYLPKLKKEKAFIFIDPYEYKHIKASQIKKLLATKKTEVLLWLPTQFMYRFETKGTPSALKEFISEFMPYEEWKSSSSVWKFIEGLTTGFQEYLGEEFFVDNFTIKKDNNTVFCLFFFTSHIKGFEKMLEAKWEISPVRGKGWHYSPNQGDLFAAQSTNALADFLDEYLKTKARTNGELYEFVLRKGFLPKHAFEVLSDWQVKGIIQVKLANGASARKKSFYISYKNYKNEYSKVFVSK